VDSLGPSKPDPCSTCIVGAAVAEDDARDKDDPQRLAEEARAQVERQTAELRKAKVPIETEPPSVYRP
jgi:hypothetical protein